MKRTLTVATLLLLLAGCTGSPHFEAHRERMTVDPGSFEEINLEMKAGDTFDYSWSSDGAVFFDIHSHNGNDIIEWPGHTTTGVAFSGHFKADIDGGYSLMWENNGGQRVALTYNANGAGTVLGR